MKRTRILTIAVLGILLLCLANSLEGAPLGSAFTYQGRLVDSDYAANGLYDFKFRLYNDANSGSQIGSEIDKMSVDVIDGYSTVELDFGSSVFDGSDCWLEIEVKISTLSDPNAYAVLKPRQKITPAPYVMYAKNTGYAQNAGNADMLDGYHANAFAPSIHSHNSLDAADGSPTEALYVDNTGSVGIGTTSPDEKLHVAGSVKIVDGSQGAGKVLTSDAEGKASWQNVQILPGGVPSGAIVMWFGSIASIPTGWALCNGSNGTPDLRDRFIVGAGNSYNVGNTGGEASHTLTIDEIPPHTHSYRYWPGWYFSGSTEYGAKGGPDDSHQTGSTGGGQPHNNLPPYHALAYIMKL
jgi:archaellum component FlaG (FlaF/FlaG flagellin family)